MKTLMKYLLLVDYMHTSQLEMGNPLFTLGKYT